VARARTRAATSNARAARTTAARASGSETSEPSANTAAAASGEFVCPECGRSFTRAASLGAHRRNTHGVAGRSAGLKQRSRRRRKSTNRTAAVTTGRSAAATTASRQATTARRTPSQTRRRSRQTANSASRNGINRDALLKTLFPNGIPASEQAIRAVSAWLDDAERLARMRF
jgi:Zinc finger, C2H2 type